MEFTIEKPKTWKGLCYPLKTSMLKDAIEDAKIDSTFHLVYWTPQKYDETYNILECEFWPADKNIEYNRFYIRAGVVKSQDRKLAETLLKSDAIPRLILFIQNKVSQNTKSTRREQRSYFKVVFVDNKILFNQ